MYDRVPGYPATMLPGPPRPQRRLWFLPAPGIRYRTFNLSVCVAVVVFCVYVKGQPSTSSTSALSWITDPTNTTLLPALVVAAGVFGTVCSYRYRWLSRGLAVSTAAAGIWCFAIGWGWCFNPTWGGAGACIIWGFVCRYGWETARNEQLRHLDSGID